MTILRHSILYIIINLIHSLASFGVAPLLSRYFSVTDYGVFVMFQTTLIFLLTTSGLNLFEIAAKRFVTQDKNHVKEFVSKSILLSVIINLFCVLVLSILKEYFGLFPNFGYKIMAELSLCAFFLVIFNHAITLILMEKKPRLYAVTQLLRSVPFCILVIILFFDHSQKFSLEKVIDIYTFCMVLAGWRSLSYLKKNNYFTLEVKNISSINKLGFSLFPYAFSSVALIYLDRFIVEKYIDVQMVAMYSVAQLFIMGIQLFFVSIGQSTGPWMYFELTKGTKEAKQKVKLLILGYHMMVFVVTLVCWQLSPYILDFLFPKEYGVINEFLPIIFIAGAFQTCFTFMSSFLKYLEKTKRLSLILSFVVVSSYCANMIFTSQYGIISVALIYMLSWMLAYILVCQSIIFGKR